MICIECGKEAELYDNLCEECFKAKKELITVPSIVDLRLCNHCGARERGKQWLDTSTLEDAMEAAVGDSVVLNNEVESSKFEFKVEFEDDKNAQIYLSAFIKIKELHVKSEHTIKVRLKNAVCNRCSKIAGDYYEAIVQLRAKDRNLEPDELKKATKLIETEVALMQKNDREIFLSKVEKTHGGLDFFIGSTQGGRNLSKTLASAFGGKVSSHPSFAGHQDGHGIYRTTFLVRIPRYRDGDIVEVNKKIVKILGYKTSKVTVLDLANGTKIYLKPNEFQNAKLIGNDESLQDAVVVSETKQELQILDPDTLKTVDVVKPRDFKFEGETVKILKYDENVFLMPQ